MSGRCGTTIINNQGACDDGDDCTTNDVCIFGDCVGFGCTNPSLCIDTSDSCAFLGDPMKVRVRLGEGDRVILAGQFVLQYDPANLQLLDIAPGSTCDPNSPFAVELIRSVDEAGGSVFYAVTVDPFGGQGTSGDATLACLTFAQHGPGGEDFCLVEGLNPFLTILIDENGKSTGIYNAADCPTNLPPPIITCAEPCKLIPALSEWGVLTITLLLLVLGKIHFGGRWIAVGR